MAAEPASGTAYLRLVLLGALIGIPAALVAALFLAFVHELEHWLWEELPSELGASSPPWYLVYLLFVGLGDWGGLDTTALAVPGLPAYEGTHLFDLLLAVAVGVVAALLVFAVRRAAARLDGDGRRRWGMPALLLGGALAVGLLAQLADVLGGDSQDVLFSGQASVPAIVSEDSAGIVLVVLAAKALGYAICLGCGFRGGPVFPAIFLGVALAALGVIAFDVSPTLAVAIGAGAGMAADDAGAVGA